MRGLLPASIALLSAFALIACKRSPERTEETPAPAQTAELAPKNAAQVRAAVRGVLEPLPERVDVDMKKVRLGRRLFHDPNLSGDGTVSCATCHSLDHGGAEARRTSTGIRSQVGPINSPTVLNAEHNFRQFWDGRAADLHEQAAGPIGNPIEMGGEWSAILAALLRDAQYVQGFQAAYPDGLKQENVIDAIAQYERYLVTPSRFDAFLRGDDRALNAQELRGLQRFHETGCTTCHRGRNVGGSMYQKMGLVRDYFRTRGGPLTEADMGRFNVTHDEADRHRFKVPTLRNVALTDPYFHDGSQANLADVVRIMANVQLGRELSDEAVTDIVAFLRALTGELPDEARLPAEGQPEGAEEAEGAPHTTEDVQQAHPDAPVGPRAREPRRR